MELDFSEPATHSRVDGISWWMRDPHLAQCARGFSVVDKFLEFLIKVELDFSAPSTEKSVVSFLCVMSGKMKTNTRIQFMSERIACTREVENRGCVLQESRDLASLSLKGRPVKKNIQKRCFYLLLSPLWRGKLGDDAGEFCRTARPLRGEWILTFVFYR